MNIQTLQTLIQCSSERDFSEKNQQECFELVKIIIIINQNLNKDGIKILDEYISNTKIKYPVLKRGLSLIKLGVEPKYIESILLNTIIINKTDFLASLIILEGISLILQNEAPHITKQILKSFFLLEFDTYFETEFANSNIKINDIQVLSEKEIQELLNKV